MPQVWQQVVQRKLLLGGKVMAGDLKVAIDLLKRVDNLIPLESLLWIARSSQYRPRSAEIMHLLMDIRVFLENLEKEAK